MDPLYYDTETCGFHGPIVLIQYAIGDGEIKLYCPWTNMVCDTIELIEMFMDHEGGVIGFNLAFDHFHLQQMHNVLLLMDDEFAYLDDCIVEYAMKEGEGRDGPCLKPQHALDLMLHARKGEYQSTMDRKDIRIKKIPEQIAWELADELGERIPLKDVYFARKKDKTERWKVYDILDEDDEVIPGFKDVVLKFAPSSGLKALAEDIFGIDETVSFSEIDLPDKYRPFELGYAPFATAPFTDKKGIYREPREFAWAGKWPQVIKEHISHWTYNAAAREYAIKDVVYTRGLHEHFGYPELDDNDSILACMVGSVRWRGYVVNLPAIEKLRDESLAVVKGTKYNFNSNPVCKAHMLEVLTNLEMLGIMVDGKLSTKGIILEGIAKWASSDDVCDDCYGEGCAKCNDGFIDGVEGSHPAAERAKEILAFRQEKLRVSMYNKFLSAGRFHASFKVIGTLSSRMAGGDGLNAQGINHEDKVRSCFPLAQEGEVLCGGDFSGFEVSLADAVYGDPALREDLQSGKKIHALFGQYLFPPMTYDEISATKGMHGAADKYSRSKQGVFAMLYGGEGFTLSSRVGISEEIADKAYQRWLRKYKVWGEARKKTFEMFCPMRQIGGIGSRIVWAEPAEFIESMFGFRRYFTLENSICRTLFELAEKPPKAWKEIKAKVIRRDRTQTTAGAAQSALFAAAFAIQSSNMRAGANHEIQSAGASMTKELQCRIWTIQPKGAHPWQVQPMNIHDEIMTPTIPSKVNVVQQIVDEYVIEFQEQVPLLEIEWGDHFDSWATAK